MIDLKKTNNQNKTVYESENLDLSNPIIKKMVEWIEHPLEFGKKPEKIEIANERILFLPNNQKEKCYLLTSVQSKDLIKKC